MINVGDVQRIKDLMPFRRAVKLSHRLEGDEFADAVTWPTARQRAKVRAIEAIGNALGSPEMCEFLLVAHEGQLPPNVDDRITDADGVMWSIMSVFTKFFDDVHVCTCKRLVEVRQRD